MSSGTPFVPATAVSFIAISFNTLVIFCLLFGNGAFKRQFPTDSFSVSPSLSFWSASSNSSSSVVSSSSSRSSINKICFCFSCAFASHLMTSSGFINFLMSFQSIVGIGFDEDQLYTLPPFFSQEWLINISPSQKFRLSVAFLNPSVFNFSPSSPEIRNQ